MEVKLPTRTPQKFLHDYYCEMEMTEGSAIGPVNPIHQFRRTELGQ